MALTVGTNAYLNATAATAYFADRLRSTAWTAAAAGDRDQALIQATRLIDAEDFRGYRAGNNQALAWPRSGKRADNALLDPTVVPAEVLNAVCETALVLLGTDLYANDDLANARRVFQQVGPVTKSVEYDGRKGSASRLPDIALKLLAPLLDGSSGSSAAWVV
ncbi:MAG: DnaT-like ssDNA-binding protein [Alsobacter sp.]